MLEWQGFPPLPAWREGRGWKLSISRCILFVCILSSIEEQQDVKLRMYIPLVKESHCHYFLGIVPMTYFCACPAWSVMNVIEYDLTV